MISRSMRKKRKRGKNREGRREGDRWRRNEGGVTKDLGPNLGR